MRRVSRYSKFRDIFAPHEVGDLVNMLKGSTYTGRIDRRHTCDDPDDAYLLDLADASGADFLVTGDLRAGLLSRKRIGRASIVTASAFISAIRG